MKPEYPHWDRQPEYVLTDAAQLCCDNEPQPWARETISPKVEAMARRIKVELTACRDTSQTFYSPNYGGGKPLPIHVPGEQFYKREDLCEWAERTGQRAAMPFLFPGDRAESAGAIGAGQVLSRLEVATPSLEASPRKIVVTVTDREAIPARALPFVTAWTLSPDRVADELAEHSHTRKLAEGLRAYHLSECGDPIEMQPKEWDMVVRNLKALSARLDAAVMSREESYAFWRHNSILCLPSGVFLWRDEFDRAFFGGDIWTIANERPGDRKWSTVPLIPNELHEAVVEGFQAKGLSEQPEPADGVAPAETATERPSRRLSEDALYGVVRALALALMDTDPGKFKKNERPLIGYAKASGERSGIVGHLEGQYTDLKTTTIETALRIALKSD